MRTLAPALIILVVVTGIMNRDLWNPHEHRDGAIALDMARSGDWVVPRLAGEPFLEKPPLTYATGALLVRLLPTEPARTIRAASALYALGTALCLLAMARVLVPTSSPWIAPGMLVTTLGFYLCGHFIVTDVGLVFFVTLAYLALVKFAFEGKTGWRLVLYAAVGGAFLSKGVVGCVLPAAGIVAFALLAREPKLIWRTVSWSGLLVFGLVVAAWLVPLAGRDGGAHLREWWRQNLERFLGADQRHLHHEQNPLYYLYAFPYVCLPWSLAWPFAIGAWWRAGRPRPSRAACLSIAWLGSGLVLLSISTTKRDLYAYPLIVPAVLLLARFVAERGTSPAACRLPTVAAGAVAAGLLASLLAQMLGVTSRPGFGAAAVAGGMIALIAGLAAHAARRQPTPLALVAAPAMLLVQFNALAVPAMDAVLSWREPVANVVRVVDAVPVVVGWQLGESLAGALDFYGNRRFTDFQKWKQLREYLRHHANARVLADLDRFDHPELHALAEPEFEQAFGDSTVALLRQPRKHR